MDEILNALRDIYKRMVQKEADVSGRLASVEAREKNVKIREERNTEYESASDIHEATKQIRKEIEDEKNNLQEERIKFDNWVREERQALNSERTRLLPLQDAEKQLAKDRTALEEEKRTFKERYIEKIKQFVRDNSKVPDPNAIT